MGGRCSNEISLNIFSCTGYPIMWFSVWSESQTGSSHVRLTGGPTGLHRLEVQKLLSVQKPVKKHLWSAWRGIFSSSSRSFRLQSPLLNSASIVYLYPLWSRAKATVGLIAMESSNQITVPRGWIPPTSVIPSDVRWIALLLSSDFLTLCLIVSCCSLSFHCFACLLTRSLSFSWLNLFAFAHC